MNCQEKDYGLQKLYDGQTNQLGIQDIENKPYEITDKCEITR